MVAIPANKEPVFRQQVYALYLSIGFCRGNGLPSTEAGQWAGALLVLFGSGVLYGLLHYRASNQA